MDEFTKDELRDIRELQRAVLLGVLPESRYLCEAANLRNDSGAVRFLRKLRERGLLPYVRVEMRGREGNTTILSEWRELDGKVHPEAKYTPPRLGEDRTIVVTSFGKRKRGAI